MCPVEASLRVQRIGFVALRIGVPHDSSEDLNGPGTVGSYEPAKGEVDITHRDVTIVDGSHEHLHERVVVVNINHLQEPGTARTPELRRDLGQHLAHARGVASGVAREHPEGEVSTFVTCAEVLDPDPG